MPNWQPTVALLSQSILLHDPGHVHSRPDSSLRHPLAVDAGAA